ncbi:MAG TPA: hypothetical protein VMU46_10580 [Burkholderiales bacterium]|nr:hypothetical protein [Burkholderiales bacterium]
MKFLRTISTALLFALAIGANAQPNPSPGGASWKYSYADLQYSRFKFTFTVRAPGVGGDAVEETFAVDGGSGIAATVDARSGKYLSRMLGSSRTVLEYLPYALAGGEPPASWPTPSGYPTYSTPYLEWSYTTKAVGWESVTVPAGTFRALRVEIEGHRGKDPDPYWWPKQAARFQHTFWYAPEVKRYVKAHHLAWAMTASQMADEAVELLEYRPD